MIYETVVCQNVGLNLCLDKSILLNASLNGERCISNVGRLNRIALFKKITSNSKSIDGILFRFSKINASSSNFTEIIFFYFMCFSVVSRMLGIIVMVGNIKFYGRDQCIF